MTSLEDKANLFRASTQAYSARLDHERVQFVERQAALLHEFLESANNSASVKMRTRPVYRVVQERITVQPVPHRPRGAIRRFVPARHGNVVWGFATVASGWVVASKLEHSDGYGWNRDGHRHSGRFTVLSTSGTLHECIGLNVPSVVAADSWSVSASTTRVAATTDDGLSVTSDRMTGTREYEFNQGLFLNVETHGLGRKIGAYVIHKSGPIGVAALDCTDTNDSINMKTTQLERTLVGLLTGIGV